MSQFLRQTFQRAEFWVEPAHVLVNCHLWAVWFLRVQEKVEDIDLLNEGCGQAPAQSPSQGLKGG